MSRVAHIPAAKGLAFTETVELVLCEIALDKYAPDVLDTNVHQLVHEGTARLRELGLDDPRSCQIEVSLSLSSDDADLRPALHLSADTLAALNSIGASFDFDPYIAFSD